MTETLTEKIIKAHLVDGRIQFVEEIGLKVDLALMQDATGTIACLHFETLDISKPKIEFDIVYVPDRLLHLCAFE